MLGYDRFPAALRRYVIGISLVGPGAAVGGLIVGGARVGGRELLIAGILTVLAAVAERTPLHLTHQMTVHVATAAYIAMILTLPVALPGVLALVAIAVAQELRRRTNPDVALPEMLFNVGQGALYVAAGAVTFAALRHGAPGPDLAGFGSVTALVTAATVIHLANTALVSGAAGFQLGVSPLRVWRQNVPLDLTAHVALSILGVITAVVAVAEPVLLPFLALPGLLMQRSVKQAVRLRTDTHDALASLVEIVELRDPYTAGHSRRVAATARLLAERLGLTAEEADLVESAGRVHDLGKVAIDPLVLLKSGKLDAAEWAQMRLHPVYGADVVERFAAYQTGARLVRHHHEQWDGAGYPDRLAGETIPLGARILAVADTFDALTSDRPYRAGLPVARAAAILEEGAGTQWDPQIVDAMLALLRDTPGHATLNGTQSSTELSAPSSAERAPARAA